MQGLVRAGALFLVVSGALIALLSFFMPIVLAFGLGVMQGLSLMFGGLLLLILASLSEAVHQVAKALRQQQHVMEASPATSAAFPSPPQQNRQEKQAKQKPAGEQQPSRQQHGHPKPVKQQHQLQPTEQKPALQHMTPGDAPETMPAPSSASSPPSQQHRQEKQAKQEPEPEEMQRLARQNSSALPQTAQEQQSILQHERPEAARQKTADDNPTQQRQQVADQQPVQKEASLYVVEERVIRGRPARILSDGTIEAELDEGWLRFENEGHLDEYMDALEELRRQGVL